MNIRVRRGRDQSRPLSSARGRRLNGRGPCIAPGVAVDRRRGGRDTAQNSALLARLEGHRACYAASCWPSRVLRGQSLAIARATRPPIGVGQEGKVYAFSCRSIAGYPTPTSSTPQLAADSVAIGFDDLRVDALRCAGIDFRVAQCACLVAMTSNLSCNTTARTRISTPGVGVRPLHLRPTRTHRAHREGHVLQERRADIPPRQARRGGE